MAFLPIRWFSAEDRWKHTDPAAWLRWNFEHFYLYHILIPIPSCIQLGTCHCNRRKQLPSLDVYWAAASRLLNPYFYHRLGRDHTASTRLDRCSYRARRGRVYTILTCSCPNEPPWTCRLLHRISQRLLGLVGPFSIREWDKLVIRIDGQLSAVRAF